MPTRSTSHSCEWRATQLLGYADDAVPVAAGAAVGRPGRVHVPAGFPSAAHAALTPDATALILSLAEQHQVRRSAVCTPPLSALSLDTITY